MTTERDYLTAALDGAVAIIGAVVVGYATIEIAGLFGLTVAIGTPAIATAAFTVGLITGATVGLVGAIRWPERAVEIHDRIVPEREE